MATAAALKASVFSSVSVMALKGQKTTRQPAQACRWGWHLQWGSLGSQVPTHGGVLPNPTQAGASSEQDTLWSRSSEPKAGWSSQRSALPSWWSMEVLWWVCSHPVNLIVVVGVSPDSIACTTNHRDVKAGVALALALPFAGRIYMWETPSTACTQTAIFITVEVSNLNPADFLISDVNLYLAFQHQRHFCHEIYRTALVLLMLSSFNVFWPRYLYKNPQWLKLFQLMPSDVNRPSSKGLIWFWVWLLFCFYFNTSFPHLSPQREVLGLWGNVRFLQVLESFLVAWSFMLASTHICGAFEPLINRSRSCGCFMCNHGTEGKWLRSQAQCTGSGVIPAIHQCWNPYEIQKRFWHAICSLHHGGLGGGEKIFF